MAFLDDGALGDVEQFVERLPFLHDCFPGVVKLLCPHLVIEAVSQLLLAEDLLQLGLDQNSFVHIQQLHFGRVLLQEENLLVDLGDELLAVLVFDLAVLDQLFDVLVLVGQQVVLSSAMFYRLTNFREHMLYALDHVPFGLQLAQKRFHGDRPDEFLTLLDPRKYFGGFFMPVDEIDDHVVGEGQLAD